MEDVISQTLGVNDNRLCPQIINVNVVSVLHEQVCTNEATSGHIMALRISYSYLFNSDGSLPVSVCRMVFGFLQPTDPTCL